MKQLSFRDLAVFCEQISMMIRSGIMLHAGMQMIADDTSNVQKKAIFQDVSTQLAKGDMLDVALRSSPVFPEYMIHMVEIGTSSGKLDTVLTALSAYYNRQQSMRDHIRSAVVYPFVLILMMLIVLIFLAAKVLPVFEQVFKSLGTQMSPWASHIMKIGSLFNQYSLVLVLLFLLLVAAGLFMTRMESGRTAFTGFLMGKKTSEKFAVATFTSSMALMLSSGLDLELAMRLSSQAISDRTVGKKVEGARALMAEGALPFIEALQKSDLLSNAMTGLLSMGYQAGSVDSAMEYIAGIYEEEYQTALMRKVAMIEPVSIIIVSVLIGSILVSVMFPLLGVLSTIG
ncbi:type II secretion system F family protein [Desulfitobacterium sp. PCE1]|uniref:type II secretion system F family protein n=1 Tax=Desulfitobacterium sp. PCE1 TaxID=146907 RepID=UPI000382992D|nr:type II secretion system F family protein [Desulfitobacterium sp. PCE1]